MHFTSALLFALSANIDCLAVGLSMGIRSVKIKYSNILIIALVSSLGTYLSMSVGMYVSQFISIALANLIGSVLLIAMGIMMLYQYYQEKYIKKKSKSLEDYDKNKSGEIEGKEILLLSCGLALNNMGLGIGASITGIPIISSSILTLFVSFIFVSFSQYLGKVYMSDRLNQRATLIAGILILALGIYELFL